MSKLRKTIGLFVAFFFFCSLLSMTSLDVVVAQSVDTSVQHNGTYMPHNKMPIYSKKRGPGPRWVTPTQAKKAPIQAKKAPIQAKKAPIQTKKHHHHAKKHHHHHAKKHHHHAKKHHHHAKKHHHGYPKKHHQHEYNEDQQ